MLWMDNWYIVRIVGYGRILVLLGVKELLILEGGEILV